MEENDPVIPAATPTEDVKPNQNSNTVNANGAGRTTRPNNRSGPVSSTPRDFEGATPKLGGILALRSENMSKKVNYDQFCEKLYIYIMNVFKNGDSVVEVTKNPSADIIENFKTLQKPKELTDEEKRSSIETEIKKKRLKSL